MKKHRLYLYICIFLIITIFLCSIPFCTLFPYSAYITYSSIGSIKIDARGYIPTIEDPNAIAQKSLEIGNISYDLEYHYTRKSPPYLRDIYRDNDNKLTIHFDRNSGLIAGFTDYGNNREKEYTHIGDISKMSDEEIKRAVEDFFKDYVDISVFNTFTITENEDNSLELLWQDNRGKYFSSNKLRVFLDENGTIYDFKVNIGCPPEYDGNFITEEKKKELLEKKIRKYFDLKSSDPMVYYEIENEAVTNYYGKEAIQIDIASSCGSDAYICQQIIIIIVNNDS